MIHQRLSHQLVLIGLIFIILGCNSLAASTPTATPPPPTSTLTSTLVPTRTQKPPTSTPAASPTTEPFMILTFGGGETVKVAAPALALLLPLPGLFIDEDRNADGAIIGIVVRLNDKKDITDPIITDSNPYAITQKDIVITWGDPSPFFGNAISEMGFEIPVFLDPQTGQATPHWKEGFLSLVQNGRRIILKGILRTPIANQFGRNIEFVLEYKFGENSSIYWDSNSQQLVWVNMTVTKLPYP